MKLPQENRLAELNEDWYHVELYNIEIHGFRASGKDRPVRKDFSGRVIAKSGADAYDKAAKHLDETLLQIAGGNKRRVHLRRSFSAIDSG